MPHVSFRVDRYGTKNYFWDKYLTPEYIFEKNYQYVWLMDGDIMLSTIDWDLYWKYIFLFKPMISQPSVIFEKYFDTNKILSIDKIQGKHGHGQNGYWMQLNYLNHKINDFIDIDKIINIRGLYNCNINLFNTCKTKQKYK